MKIVQVHKELQKYTNYIRTNIRITIIVLYMNQMYVNNNNKMKSTFYIC